MDSNEYIEVLENVRKAYRLIYLYQRRVLDLMQYIGSVLKIKYSGGHSWYADTVAEGKGSLYNWSWDWLPMYFYEFNFKPFKSNDGYYLKFSIVIQSDTGFYDGGSDDPLSLNRFSSSFDSQTRLLFLIGKDCWWTDYKDDYYDDSFYNKEKLQDIKIDGDKILLYKAYNLLAFIDNDSTIIALNDFVRFCQENGISELQLNQ